MGSHILDLTSKIGNVEFSLSLLKSLRAKIENSFGFTNRIGKSFKRGYKGVLAIGGAGSGKTQTLERMFRGIELHKYNQIGKPLGKWMPSGISTGVGLFSLLKEHHDAIIVIDELDASTPLHVNILKQISSGVISRMKHGETNSSPFTGILWGATNGIPFKPAQMPHILAMLERFTLCLLNGDKSQDYFSQEQESNLSENEWILIQNRLLTTCDYDLSTEELEFAKELFQEKQEESLDDTKALYRQANDIIDICTFIKRFSLSQDILIDDKLISIIRVLVVKTVHTNPAKLLLMDPIERDIYSFISCSEEGSSELSAILNFCDNNGIFTDQRQIKNILKKMVSVRILNSYRGDIYTTRKSSDNKMKSALADALITKSRI